MLNKWVLKLLAVCAIAAVAELSVPSISSAQAEAPLPRTLSVTGLGRAAVPADKAVITVSYVPNYYNEPDPQTGSSIPTATKISDIEPIFDAIAAAGIPLSAISATRDPYDVRALRLIVRVDEPTQALLSELLDIATTTTLEAGKIVSGNASVLYTVKDCEQAETAAYRDAVSATQRQAYILSSSAEVDLGNLLDVSAYAASWGSGSVASLSRCPNTVEDVIGLAQYGGQSYDLALPTQVIVEVNVSATYEIE